MITLQIAAGIFLSFWLIYASLLATNGAIRRHAKKLQQEDSPSPPLFSDKFICRDCLGARNIGEGVETMGSLLDHATALTAQVENSATRENSYKFIYESVGKQSADRLRTTIERLREVLAEQEKSKKGGQ